MSGVILAIGIGLFAAFLGVILRGVSKATAEAITGGVVVFIAIVLLAFAHQNGATKLIKKAKETSLNFKKLDTWTKDEIKNNFKTFKTRIKTQYDSKVMQCDQNMFEIQKAKIKANTELNQLENLLEQSTTILTANKLKDRTKSTIDTRRDVVLEYKNNQLIKTRIKRVKNKLERFRKSVIDIQTVKGQITDHLLELEKIEDSPADIVNMELKNIDGLTSLKVILEEMPEAKTQAITEVDTKLYKMIMEGK